MMSNSAMRKGCNLVLDNFDFGSVAYDLHADLDLFAAADVKTNRRVKFERPPARRGLGLPNMTPTFSRSWW